MSEEEERELVKQMGCMASFFHFFDRPHILSTSRQNRLSSSHSQMSGSVSPSERSEQSGPLTLREKDTIKSRPPSPEPDPNRASLSVFKTASTWKLKEAPRLSLDSRLRPREIRTTVDQVQEPDNQNHRSPSVVARLMGVEILPTASGPGWPAQLRRSNSESRVPRDSHRFMDSVTHNVSNNRRVFLPDPKADPGPGSGSRVSNPHPFHKKSSFEPVDCFPEPAKRSVGEITLYGEIERRLRRRGIEEPSKDIETLKQVLEALQLKGLLHSQPLDQQSDGRRSLSDDHHHHHQLKPPIVLMRSKPARSPKIESGFISCRAGSGPMLGLKKDQMEMDPMVRRSRSPDRSNYDFVRSLSSPGRRRNSGGNMESPKSPQRRISPVRMVQEPVLSVRVGRRRMEVSSLAEDDTSTSVSGSSVTTSAALDFERSRSGENSKSGRSLLDRCDKLLNSIVAFTATDQGDPQPSPVSVLDTSILHDDSSPSPSAKRHLTPPKSPNPNSYVLEPLFDSSEDELCTVASESGDPDYFYIREFLHESSRYRDLSKAYDLLKKRHQSSPATWRHRTLIYDAVKDFLEGKRHVSSWDWFTSSVKFKKEPLLNYVWLEIQKIRDPTVGSCEMVDLNEATCKAIEKDFAADRWENPSAELSDAVLQVERLVFKDLIADTIQELADVAIYMVPRRKLVF